MNLLSNPLLMFGAIALGIVLSLGLTWLLAR